LVKDLRLVATSSYFFRINDITGLPVTLNACNYQRWNPSSFMFRANVLQRCGVFVDKLLGSDCEFIARIENTYGVNSHRRIRLPLAIGLQRNHSLSARFPIGGQNSLIRLKHWESWRRKHVALASIEHPTDLADRL